MLTLPGNGNVVQIDEKLLIGIQRLNELGFTTRFCCQGGSGYDIAYIALEPGKCFPPELQRAWTGAAFEVTTSEVYATGNGPRPRASARWLHAAGTR